MINKKYQKVWEYFKNNHTTEEYTLKEVFDIYIPFWQCKQNVVIEKEVELDRFSRILLELVDQGVSTHTDLCSFLGIEEASFPTIQFHFLLKNDLLCEPQIGVYEITHEGIKFLQDKKKLKKMASVEFEYFTTERLDYLQNDLTQAFFDPNLPIDQKLSTGRKKSFGGYKIMQSHKIQKGDETAKKIPHQKENKPTSHKIRAKRNDFADFFNTKFKGGVFYDFADSKLETHKRNICFIGLLYEQEETGEQKLDIRHSAKSIHSFKKKNTLEKTLSDEATAYISKNALEHL